MADMTCNICGTDLEDGWTTDLETMAFSICDSCFADYFFRVLIAPSQGCVPHVHEFRTCDACGAAMDEGYTGDGAIHVCVECFPNWMNENCDAWRMNEHAEFPLWEGGYYDELIDGEWVDTGLFYTQWD